MSPTNNYDGQSSKAKLAELLGTWNVEKVEQIEDLDAQAEGWWLLHRVEADLDGREAGKAQAKEALRIRKRAYALAALKRGNATNSARSARLKEQVRAALAADPQGNHSRMAKALGCARSTFHKMKREIAAENAPPEAS